MVLTPRVVVVLTPRGGRGGVVLTPVVEAAWSSPSVVVVLTLRDPLNPRRQTLNRRRQTLERRRGPHLRGGQGGVVLTSVVVVLTSVVVEAARPPRQVILEEHILRGVSRQRGSLGEGGGST